MHGGNARKTSHNPFVILIVTLSALALSACAGAPSTLNPVSQNTQDISRLTLLLFGIAAVVFVVVEGLLVFATIYFHNRRAGKPSQTEGNPRMEFAWTLAPAIVLAVVFVLTLPTLRSLANQPATYTNPLTGQIEKPILVKAVGHQWWWEFDYPDLGIVTSDVMHVPAGAVVNVDVESVDVVHSFWIPQVVQKVDAIPGHTNRLWFQVKDPGVYSGQCAEFCGEQHAGMRMQVIIEPQDQFDAWAKGQTSPLPQLTGAAAQGEQAFMGGSCTGCHTIDTTKAQGKIGPNLTHFGSREAFAGAMLENTPENLAKWLANPQQVKPGTLMPDLHLSQDQIAGLVAFLESLK